MGKRFDPRRALLAAAAAFSLVSCGGGGGSGSPPGLSGGPTPTPTPTPTPSPTPTPTGGLDDQEYRGSPWLVTGRALPAFESGGTGNGSIFALIDNGISSTDPEFAGRTETVAGGEAGSASHGSAVARIAVGARNGNQTMGVAFETTILSYNTMSCPGDCFHSIDDVAAAIDDAVSRNARVINISLVGDNNREPMLSAVRRATEAGVIVVLAAGNGGSESPNGFALQPAIAADSDLVIIAGAHDSDYEPTVATDRAGAGSRWYISAYSGGATSFSAPVVSGTVALIAASFPDLTGQQIVEILRDSAEDAGAPGRDAIFGHGILNIGAAFALAEARSGN